MYKPKYTIKRVWLSAAIGDKAKDMMLKGVFHTRLEFCFKIKA